MEKSCNKCDKKFKLIQQELDFYKKMGVPEPEKCPFCRQDARMAQRNEREFFKYPCAKCEKQMVTTVNPDKGLTVYCLDCYAEFRANVDLTKE